MLAPLRLALVALLVAAASARQLAAAGVNATLSFDLAATKPITKTLFGIFFEEIGHAGDGGLYAELIQDRSFDALAFATGFAAPDGGEAARGTATGADADAPSAAKAEAAGKPSVPPLRQEVDLASLRAEWAAREPQRSAREARAAALRLARRGSGAPRGGAAAGAEAPLAGSRGAWPADPEVSGASAEDRSETWLERGVVYAETTPESMLSLESNGLSSSLRRALALDDARDERTEAARHARPGAGAVARGPSALADASNGASASTPLAGALSGAKAQRPLGLVPTDRSAGLPAPAAASSASASSSAPESPLDAVIVAWSALPGTTTTLTRSAPLDPDLNPVALELSSQGAEGLVGVVNDGYWGIHVEEGEAYVLSLFARAPGSADARGEARTRTGDSGAVTVTVALFEESDEEAELRDGGAEGPKGGGARDGSGRASASLSSSLSSSLSASVRVLASANVTLSASGWAHLNATLVPAARTTKGKLLVSFRGPGSVTVDVVSLFPRRNLERAEAAGLAPGVPWPFREDLLEVLRALTPGFLRFPGGCYIEGDVLSHAVRWKRTIGPVELRPGHLNGVWSYWSTDGLGHLEYLLLAEALETQPVWVVQAGVAHQESVAPRALGEWVQDALDGVEFAVGDPDASEWGAKRAAMGRREPFPLPYVAIGNEDCGKPRYLENYLLMYSALKTRYPSIRLVSNCDLGQDAPVDLYDWHIYTNPRDLFNKRTVFDRVNPFGDPHVFASEYAVTDGGGWGNLRGALAEAAFMTGLERNGEAVEMAAYAPLFVHTDNRPWPTNLIVIDNARHYVIPSYHVQQLFRRLQGLEHISSAVAVDPATAAALHEDVLATSASCLNASCSSIAIKIINVSSYRLRVNVTVTGVPAGAAVARADVGGYDAFAGVEVAAEAQTVVEAHAAADAHRSADASFSLLPSFAGRLPASPSAARSRADPLARPAGPAASPRSSRTYAGTATVLTSPHPEDENDFGHPDRVAPTSAPFGPVDGDAFEVGLEPYSATFLELHEQKDDAAAHISLRRTARRAAGFDSVALDAVLEQARESLSDVRNAVSREIWRHHIARVFGGQ